MRRRFLTIAYRKTLLTISGTVTDGASGVDGVTVALGAYSAVTAGGGLYTIPGIPAGTAGSLTATKTGYAFPAIAIAAMGASLTGQNFANAWWAMGGNAAHCLRAYVSLGAASLAAAYVNLPTPGTGDLTARTGAPDWAAISGWAWKTGFTGLRTGLTPVAGGSYIARITGCTGVNQFVFGCAGDTNAKVALCAQYGGTSVRYINGAALNIAGALDTGTIGIAAQKGYRNGSAETGTMGAWSGTAQVLDLMASADDGGGILNPGNLLVFAAWDNDMATQMAALHTAISNLT
jgi:hypothetical protein